MDNEGAREAFETGRGRIVIRSRAEIEVYGSDRERIIVTEVPYQVNKALMIERTAELVNEKKLEGISAIRDESNREGIRVVYEIKRDANAAIVLNNLFKYTALQTSFSGKQHCISTWPANAFKLEGSYPSLC